MPASPDKLRDDEDESYADDFEASPTRPPNADHKAVAFSSEPPMAAAAAPEVSYNEDFVDVSASPTVPTASAAFAASVPTESMEGGAMTRSAAAADSAYESDFVDDEADDYADEDFD